MANLGGFFIPSLSATLNVAWETCKALWPENSPCMELIRGPGTGAGFEQQGERVDGAEMTTLNNGAGTSYGEKKHVTMAEDSFSYQRSG